MTSTIRTDQIRQASPPRPARLRRPVQDRYVVAASPSRWSLRRERRAAARRLHEADLAAARRAELHHMLVVLREAGAMVERGWVQGAWLRVGGTDGRTRTVTSGALDLVDPRVVTGACLVGAVVQVGGGRAAGSPLRAQLVRRTLDAVWQTLCAHEVRPGRACAPAVLRARVRDLTRWNDTGGRTAGEVRALLVRTEDRVRAAAAAAA